MTTTAPPQWALTLAEGRDGLRQLTRSLLEEEHGRPLWPLDALLAVAGIPAEDRAVLLASLRRLDNAEYDIALGDGFLVEGAINDIVHAYDKAKSAPPLTDDEVHDCHTEVTPAMLARAELHQVGDPRRCDVDARIDELVALLNDGPDLFGAAANYATAAELRARPLPQRVPGASLAANPPPNVDQPGTEAAA